MKKIPLPTAGEVILHYKPPGQAWSAAREQEKQGGNGHDAESAGLNKRKNDYLAERGKCPPGIHNDQAGYTGCGC